MKLLSNIARGFSEEYFWKKYCKARNSKGLLKTFYTFIYMKMADKSGGYIGRETTLLGPLHLPHGFHGIHISRFCTIGEDCTIFQNVTIGNSGGGGAACIGNNVLIGANAVLIGDIHIGNNVKIGAGAIVTKDVPDNSTVIGNTDFRIIPHDFI